MSILRASLMLACAISAQHVAAQSGKLPGPEPDQPLRLQAVPSSASVAPVAPPTPRTRGAASFTNATAIGITDCPNPCPASGQAATLYPSPITVSGETGVVENVSVTLNGLSHAFPADVDFLLVSPSGRKSVLFSDFGAGSPGVSNINVTLDDYAQRPIPAVVTGNTGVPFVTGSYRPANSGTTDLWPAPAPASPYTYTLSAFNGDTPNGTWSLYVIDDANLDGGNISGGWTLTLAPRPTPPAAGSVLISEFRTRGAGTTPPGSDGSADEFIEIYNNTDQSITIIDSVPGADPTSPTGAGWRFAGAQGAAETTFLVLPQTLSVNGPLALAPRGYYLISTQPTTPSPAGNTYSLQAYPTGTGFTASGVANVSVNPASATVGFLPDDVGIAVFSTASATSARRLDSVGYSSVTQVDYKEGAGLAPAAGITTAGQHSWSRAYTAAGTLQDTGNNAADFVLVDPTAATLNGVAARLGAPGPQRAAAQTGFTTSASPTTTPTFSMAAAVIDPMQPASAAPNFVRDPTAVANAALGTMKFRRRYTNNTGKILTALRFRVAGITTLTGGAVPAGTADLRVLNSTQQTITLTDTSTVTSQALTVQTPAAQALGGGVNSSLAAGIITTTAPLAIGGSIVVEFNIGVQVDGNYSIVVVGEANSGDGIGGVSVVDGFQTTADLGITKTNGATSSVPGNSTTYTIAATNTGPNAVIGATVADTFPAALTCTWTCVGAAGGTCTASGSGNINDSAVNLPVGGTATYTAVCAIAASATGSLANTATVSALNVTDPTPANNSATDTDTLTPQANLGITKTDGATTAFPNGTSTYTITASNAGPSTAPGSTVTDTFPAALTGCTWTCTGAGGGTCPANGTGNINATVNLPAGGSTTFTAMCTVAGSATGTIANTATVAAGAGVTDPTPGNNSATDTNTVAPPGQLTINPATVNFGNVPPNTTSAVQTVTLGNSGGSPLQVTALTAASAAFARTGAGTCSATLPITIANGSSCTLTYTFTPPASGPFSQMLTVTANSPGSGTITLQGMGGIGVLGVLASSVDFGPVLTGANKQLTVTITNTGTGPLSVTSVSAVLPPFSLVAGGTCGTTPFTVAAGGSCTLIYQFSPTSEGLFLQPITITADVGATTVTLRGRGVVSIQTPVAGGPMGLLLLGLLGATAFGALRRRG